MGLRASLRRWLLADAGNEAPAASAPIAGTDGMNDVFGSTFGALSGNGPAGALNMNERAAMSLPAVMRALEILTGVFAMTPLVYYRKDATGKHRVEGTSLGDLFRVRPNGVQNAFVFKEAMLGDMLLAGGSFSYVHRDAAFQVSALSRLDPGVGVNRQWDKTDGPELFYDAQLPDGKRERLTRADCWHVPGFTRDGLVGLNRIQLLRDALAGAVATSEFAAKFWENNAQPTTVLSAKAKIEQADKDKIKAGWKRMFGGARNAGEVAVVDQELTPHFHTHDNKAAQYLETRAFHVVEVARAFGVPPHLLFELSRATFSNIEQQQLEFVIFSMMTHYERVAAAATHYFAEPGHFYEFMPDALLKGDIKSRYEAYGTAIDKGILNPNEVRRRENENDRPGGDEYRVGSGSTIEGQEPAKPAPPADHRPPAPTPSEEDA